MFKLNENHFEVDLITAANFKIIKFQDLVKFLKLIDWLIPRLMER